MGRFGNFGRKLVPHFVLCGFRECVYGSGLGLWVEV